MTEQEVLRDLWTASWMSKGQPPNDRDTAGWLGYSPGLLARGRELHYRGQVYPDWESGRAYQFDRMLGWQSGGDDVPPFGNWSNPPKQFHAVPPFPGDAGGGTVLGGAGTSTGSPSSPSSEPPAAQPPPAPASPEASTDLATVLARMNARFDYLERLAERSYTGTVTLPKVMGGGSRRVTLHPVTPGRNPDPEGA